MCVIPVVCVTNKGGGVVVLFDYTTLLITINVNWKLEKSGRKIRKIFSGVIPVFS